MYIFSFDIYLQLLCVAVDCLVSDLREKLFANRKETSKMGIIRSYGEFYSF
jgi:hypothetical protein